jgi:hypothetical protein
MLNPKAGLDMVVKQKALPLVKIKLGHQVHSSVTLLA